MIGHLCSCICIAANLHIAVFVQAYVWPCGTAIRSDDVYVITGYGKPDAIATAYVASQMETDNCVIEWSHDYKDGNITSFEVSKFEKNIVHQFTTKKKET